MAYIQQSEKSTTMATIPTSPSIDSTDGFLAVLHFMIRFPSHIESANPQVARNMFVPFAT